MTRPVLIILLLALGMTSHADVLAQEAPSDQLIEVDDGIGLVPDSMAIEALFNEMPISADLGRRVMRARAQVLAMDLVAVTRALDGPVATLDEEALVGWTNELSSLIVLLVADQASDYKVFLDRNEALYERIEDAPGTAWRHWLMGEISLQRTWARSKRGDSFKAAWSARRALKHLERARELDPDFVEPLKGIGLLHMGIGALPDRFRRVLGWFGISGTLEEGLAELELAMTSTIWNATEAAVLLATVDKFGFPSPVNASDVYERLWRDHHGSPLIALSYADVLIRERRPMEALTVLEAASDPSASVHYLTWYRGEALYHLGRCSEAMDAFSEYERIHQGPSLKMAGRLLAGQCAELAGRREEAVAWYTQIVDERGFAEELAAIRKASALQQRPMTATEKALLRAWGSFNSGDDEVAQAAFSMIVEASGTAGEERAEAAYGVARVHHEAGNASEAIRWYQRTLSEPADPLAKWHGFARMHLISLFLDAGDIEAARATKQDLESMDATYDFRSSVENRVRLLDMD